jgi:hypothetical protein
MFKGIISARCEPVLKFRTRLMPILALLSLGVLTLIRRQSWSWSTTYRTRGLDQVNI